LKLTFKERVTGFTNVLEMVFHWVGLRENLQETPILNGKNHGFL
jgi:hypothetical protein